MPRVLNGILHGIAEVMKSAEIARYLASGYIDPVGSTPAEMSTLIRQERERWGAVIRATGAKAD